MEGEPQEKIDDDPKVEDKMSKWFRPWLTTSKPTEWISSVSSLVVVIGGLLSGLYVLQSGYLDNKNTQVKIETTKLEIAKLKLEEENQKVQNTIIRKNVELENTKQKMENLAVNLGETQRSLNIIRAQQEKAEAQNKAVAKLDELNKGLPSGLVDYERDSEFEVVALSLGHQQQSGAYPVQPKVFSGKKEFLSLASSMGNLTSLCIEGIILDVNDIKQISDLRNLKYLKMKNCNITSELVTNVKVSETVEYLDLSYNAIKAIPMFSKQEFHGINIESTDFADEQLEQLLARVKSVKYLSLDGTKVTKAGIGTLAKMKGIEFLDVSPKLVDDTTIDMVGRRPENPPSKVIKWGIAFSMFMYDFKDSDISNQGVLRLSPNEMISMVDLSGTKISDECLTQVAKFTGLQMIELEGTRVTAQGVNALCQQISAFKEKKDVWITVSSQIIDELGRNGLPNPPLDKRITINAR